MPIRLNSTRVKEKSIRTLGGRPLFCWLLQELDTLGIQTHVFCSQPRTLHALLDFSTHHVHFTPRPARLDGDDVKGIEIYRAFANMVPAEVYLLTHCTSPFLSATSLRATLDPVVKGQRDSAMTVHSIQTFAWHRNKPLNFTLPRPITQSLEKIYVETSGAYCFTPHVLDQGARTGSNPRFVEVDWPESEDIDSETDFQRCQVVAKLLREPRPAETIFPGGEIVANAPT